MNHAKEFGTILFDIVDLTVRAEDQVGWTRKALRQIEESKATPANKLFQSGMIAAGAGLCAVIEETEKPKRRPR
jgi:hypothetical protein